MLSKIRKIIRFLIKKIRCTLNPVKYYRSLGVTIGEGTKFYTKDTDIFSSEPWVVTIGERCHITGGVKFLTHDGGTLIYSKEEIDDFVIVGDITVGNNVYFGLRSTILPGITIGDNVIIGAGAIVTKDIPSNSVVVGVPARVVSTRDEYLKKIQNIKAGNDSRFYSDLDYMHSKNPKNKRK